MKFSDFENIVSPERLQRYLIACNGNKQKALILYRYNIQASQATFALVNCFEVALRNAIDKQLRTNIGEDWLRDTIAEDGIFSQPLLHKTHDIIKKAHERLLRKSHYSHSKLLAEMDFGIWKYMFSPVQYRLIGRNLLCIFPKKPKSSREKQFNQSYIFNEIDKINSLRNRIAHHEPICFKSDSNQFDSFYLKTMYTKIITLLQWMDIDTNRYLYGIDRVQKICNKIDRLKD